MTTPSRILAAVDFSDRSRVALAFAARLACRFDAELHVMHAQDPLLSAAAESRGIDLTRETEDELRAVVANTWPASRCRLHIDVMVGPPSTCIAHAAERECADVVVMSAHGMSGAQHALLGSTTEGVLRQSNVSVLVVPDEWAPANPDAADLRGEGPVIVGVDFRIPAIEAAADGAMLARAFETRLLLVHVVPALRVLGRWRQHAEAALAQRASEAQPELERIRETVDGGVPARALVTRGRVATCIGEAVNGHPHAIVVVGRSIHPAGDAAPGRTAYRVLTSARVPVLMHVAR
jgi:nucleotide-binding universal stress UspA family protein